MNRDDIIRMARVAGCHDNGEEFRFVELRYLERFAALVAAAEREACVRLAEETKAPFTADVIRARGKVVQITALRAALAEPVQEPVAWQWLDTAHFRKKIPADATPAHWRPLYTSPQR